MREDDEGKISGLALSNHPCGISHYDCVRCNVLGDDGTRTHDGTRADRYSAQYRDSHPKPGIILDHDITFFEGLFPDKPVALYEAVLPAYQRNELREVYVVTDLDSSATSHVGVGTHVHVVSDLDLGISTYRYFGALHDGRALPDGYGATCCHGDAPVRAHD